MNNDVLLNKISTIERCIKRINEVYEGSPSSLEDFTKQDSIILNIQRACKASIDIAMYLVASQKLGTPQTSRDAFDFLESNHIIDKNLAQKMKSMIGFRNIAVHDDQNVNLQIVQSIVENHLSDFFQFTKTVLKHKFN
ncbi:DUF86 domain-containing protein [Cytobacillus sp. FJAT-54145]|uniref:DUF86 domain-containing protein n=1 Tax=Cytobacillus spartinae TaxID=3299023 RepID=A0ABW6KC42_9BACI